MNQLLERLPKLELRIWLKWKNIYVEGHLEYKTLTKSKLEKFSKNEYECDTCIIWALE